MSLRAYLWVWDLPTSKTTTAERLLLLALAEHAGPDGKDIYPTNERLSRMTGLHRNSIQKARKSLEAKGLLRNEGKYQPVGNPRAIRTNYSLPVPEPPSEKGPPQAAPQGAATGTGRDRRPQGAATGGPNPLQRTQDSPLPPAVEPDTPSEPLGTPPPVVQGPWEEPEDPRPPSIDEERRRLLRELEMERWA